MSVSIDRIAEIINQTPTNLFDSNISPQFERMLPENLRILVREVYELFHIVPFNYSYLESLHKRATSLSNLYYDRYVSGSLPYSIYYLSTRFAVDINRLIHRRNPETEIPMEDSDSEPETEPEPENDPEDFPQTRQGMQQFMLSMSESDRPHNYSYIISDDVFVRLPDFLQNSLRELQIIHSQISQENMTVNETVADPKLYTKIHNLYTRIRDYLYNGTGSYSTSFITDFILTHIGNLIRYHDVYLLA